MDTELARTFLTVVSAGNFINASERLHVTQSTVSARIQNLEEQLRCKLFIRNKAGTTLTPAGEQFRKHAFALVRTVEQARHDVGIPRGFAGALTIGGRFGLWEEFLIECLPVLQHGAPDVAFRVEIGFEADLMQGLVEGRIDIGVMYTPQSRPGLKVEQLLDETLIMVATDAAALAEPGSDYVYIDWGPEFYARHSAIFPDFVNAGLSANIGWLGLRHILRNGGSGYFPKRLVRSHLASGELTAIDAAPIFTLPAYVVFPVEAPSEFAGYAIDTIRTHAQAASG